MIRLYIILGLIFLFAVLIAFVNNSNVIKDAYIDCTPRTCIKTGGTK